jgi:hypothetical protein
MESRVIANSPASSKDCRKPDRENGPRHWRPVIIPIHPVLWGMLNALPAVMGNTPMALPSADLSDGQLGEAALRENVRRLAEKLTARNAAKVRKELLSLVGKEEIGKEEIVDNGNV